MFRMFTKIAAPLCAFVAFSTVPALAENSPLTTTYSQLEAADDFDMCFHFKRSDWGEHTCLQSWRVAQILRGNVDELIKHPTWIAGSSSWQSPDSLTPEQQEIPIYLTDIAQYVGLSDTVYALSVFQGSPEEEALRDRKVLEIAFKIAKMAAEESLEGRVSSKDYARVNQLLNECAATRLGEEGVEGIRQQRHFDELVTIKKRYPNTGRTLSERTPQEVVVSALEVTVAACYEADPPVRLLQNVYRHAMELQHYDGRTEQMRQIMLDVLNS